MKLTYQIKSFKNEKGEELQYKQLYVITPRGSKVAVKAVFPTDKRLLLECAEEEAE